MCVIEEWRGIEDMCEERDNARRMEKEWERWFGSSVGWRRRRNARMEWELFRARDVRIVGDECVRNA